MMDNDRIKGAAKQATGQVRQWLGRATDNPLLKAKGKAQKTEGEIQKEFGRIKDVIREE